MINVTVSNPSALMLNCETRFGGINALRRIESAGRVSHKSENRMGDNTWERFITSVVLGHGDWSITEHETCQVSFYCDRAIANEITRHRLGAYTQESTRFVNYSKVGRIVFIPPFEIGTVEHNIWWHAVYDAVNNYQGLLARGIKPEIARDVLPNSLAVTLLVTYNLRMWRHFFLMRTTKECHPQMLQVTVPLLEKFKASIPLLYDDITPGARQADNLCKAR